MAMTVVMTLVMMVPTFPTSVVRAVPGRRPALPGGLRGLIWRSGTGRSRGRETG